MGSLNRKVDNLKEFYIRVKKTDGCWLWMKHTDKLGYGRCYSMGFSKAHRLSYFLHNGDFDRKLFVLHKCDVRNCVNPKHLFLGTQDDNMKDCARKKRIVSTPKFGTDNNMAKLTPNDVINMRNLYESGNYSYKKIAKLFNISVMTAFRAIKKQCWGHL